jgi:hypothetical protein
LLQFWNIPTYKEQSLGAQSPVGEADTTNDEPQTYPVAGAPQSQWVLSGPCLDPLGPSPEATCGFMDSAVLRDDLPGLST